MSIAEIIYQHVKSMPDAQAVEVLHFVEFLETKADVNKKTSSSGDFLEFINTLPVGNRTDSEIAEQLQTLRDEWN